MTRIAACILGGSGYGGGELLRLLPAHPQVESVRAISRKQAGQPFWKAHPNLRGVVQGEFDAEPNWRALSTAEHPVVFSAMPHLELAQQLPVLEAEWDRLGLAERLTLIDLSGDFRLDDGDAYAQAYGTAHPCPQQLGSFIYGLAGVEAGRTQGCEAHLEPRLLRHRHPVGAPAIRGPERTRFHRRERRHRFLRLRRVSR